MAGQPPPPGASEDDFLEHFFAFPSAASAAGAAGGHAGAGAGGEHSFPLALSLDAAAAEAKPVSSQLPSPARVVRSFTCLACSWPPKWKWACLWAKEGSRLHHA